MTKRALGRGLSALIPETEVGRVHEIIDLSIGEIETSPYQPRESMSEQPFKELVSSIREKGVIQPIMVRRIHGGYQVIAGERRLRAARELSLEMIPAIVKEIPEKEVLEYALIENIQREDLNPIEAARAYQRLSEEFGLKQEEISKRVGKDRATIANFMRLLKLPAKASNMVQSGILSMGHAKAILSLSSEKRQLDLADEIKKRGLSVREAEQRAGKIKRSKKSVKKGKEKKDPHRKRIEEEMQRRLGTKVEIKGGADKGKIEIHYYTHDDFDRITNIIGISSK